MPLLFVLGLGGLVSALSLRVVEPMVPLLAQGLDVDLHSAAILASAFTLPYALGQPILGPLGDVSGKERVVVICLSLLALSLFAATAAPSYGVLFACRIVGGLAAGGIIPLQLALIGDTSSMAGRQVAISRYLVAIVSGQIIGAPMAGLLSDAFGWRIVFFLAGLLVAGVALLSGLSLLPRARGRVRPVRQFGIREGYARVLANPKARICYTAVFLEGIFIYGYLPYISAGLQEHGLGSVREGGFVIGGLGLGGILFAIAAGPLLRRFGRRLVMIQGGALVFAALLADGQIWSWQGQVVAFAGVGLGFYMLHSALQTEATEFVPEARGSAVALHAFFFFIGQAVGPFFFGAILPAIGAGAATALAGSIVLAVALVTSLMLNRIDRSAAAQRPL